MKQARKWSYTKANWPAYKAAIDAALVSFTEEDKSVDEINGELTAAVLGSAQKFIPQTYPGDRRRPFYTREFSRVVGLRKKARKRAYTKGTPECHEMQVVLQNARRDRWRDSCARLDLRDSSKAWRLLRNIVWQSHISPNYGNPVRHCPHRFIPLS